MSLYDSHQTHESMNSGCSGGNNNKVINFLNENSPGIGIDNTSPTYNRNDIECDEISLSLSTLSHLSSMDDYYIDMMDGIATKFLESDCSSTTGRDDFSVFGINNLPIISTNEDKAMFLPPLSQTFIDNYEHSMMDGVEASASTEHSSCSTTEKKQVIEDFSDIGVNNIPLFNKDEDEISCSLSSLRCTFQNDFPPTCDEVYSVDSNLDNQMKNIKNDGKLLGSFANSNIPKDNELDKVSIDDFNGQPLPVSPLQLLKPHKAALPIEKIEQSSVGVNKRYTNSEKPMPIPLKVAKKVTSAGLENYVEEYSPRNLNQAKLYVSMLLEVMEKTCLKKTGGKKNSHFHAKCKVCNFYFGYTCTSDGSWKPCKKNNVGADGCNGHECSSKPYGYTADQLAPVLYSSLQAKFDLDANEAFKTIGLYVTKPPILSFVYSVLAKAKKDLGISNQNF